MLMHEHGSTKKSFRRLRAIPILLAGLLPLAIAQNTYGLQLDDTCVVNILNRTVQVRPDGSWAMPNVPASMGRVRARVTCSRDDGTFSGQTDFFTVQANGNTTVGDFQFDVDDNPPTGLDFVSGANIQLTSVGASESLAVAASYADGTSRDVTAATSGINYRSSNAGIASIDDEGVVTAVASGLALITARLDGAVAIVQVQVVTTGDIDADGMPDDYESANGLNPNDPTDALEDRDKDGLSALEEFEAGTDPNVADSDGDGLRDGEELADGNDGFITDPLNPDSDADGLRDGLEFQLGSNPLDAADRPLGAALVSLSVTPNVGAILFNTIDAEASVQLSVSGELSDGSSLDLTADVDTNYVSDNLPVCSFGLTRGQVFGGFSGACVVTVSNNGQSAAARFIVSQFAPAALSFVPVGAEANDVTVRGDTAYVAAGSAGVQAVDISDRNSPVVLGAIPGTSGAIRTHIADNLLFVAAGSNGLLIFELSAAPLAPQFRSTVANIGLVRDVRVRNARAFVAARSFSGAPSALHIIDVASPVTPAILASLNLAGTPNGVDADANGNLVAVAAGAAGVHIIDSADPGNPVLLNTTATGGAAQVRFVNGAVVVADSSNGMRSLNISNSSTSTIVSTVPRAQGGLLSDLEVQGSLVFGADFFFVNGVPIVDASDPAVLTPRRILDFSQFRDDNGTGIDVDGQFVYLVANVGSSRRLYIGRYRQRTDTGSVPPQVEITAPAANTSVSGGGPLRVVVEATDDVQVGGVSLLVDGTTVATDVIAPYTFDITVPAGVDGVTLAATALDLAGNVGTSDDVLLAVIVDSDLDGLSDAEEVALGTNPNLADTDGDGVNDGDEVNLHGTDPLLADTDGDGVSDGDEVASGLDPLDPNSRHFDDFEAEFVDFDKWGVLDFVRELDGATLHSSVRGVNGRFSNTLNLRTPDDSNRLEATVTVLRSEADPGAQTRARITGFFYNNGTPGNSQAGEVQGEIGIRRQDGNITVTLLVGSCDTDACDQFTTYMFDNTTFTAPALGEPHFLSLEYDSGTFIFQSGTQTLEFDSRPFDPVQHPSQYQLRTGTTFKGFGTRVLAFNGREGFVEARFDDMRLDDELVTDADKRELWRSSQEFVRTIVPAEDGGSELLLGLTASDFARVNNSMVIPDADTVDGIFADVTVHSMEFVGSQPRAAIGGYFFNDGTGAIGDDGDVFASLRIIPVNDVLTPVAAIFHCKEGGNCNVFDRPLFDTTTFPSTTLGRKHRLGLEFDGENFIFSVDDQSLVFDIASVVQPRRPVQHHLRGAFTSDPFKAIRVRVSGADGPGESGSVFATFDNVSITRESLLDTDGDGVSDFRERFFFRTDPTLIDSDADGLPDGFEVQFGLDPLDDGSVEIDNGPNGDPDGDLFTNLQEFEGGSDPTDFASIPGGNVPVGPPDDEPELF